MARNYSPTLLPEIATPTTPPSNYLSVYSKSDGKLYYKNDSGTEFGPLMSSAEVLTLIGGKIQVGGTQPADTTVVWFRPA